MIERCQQPQAHPARCGCEQVKKYQMVVPHADYATLQAECERLQSLNRRLGKSLEAATDHAYELVGQRTALESRLDAALAYLAAIKAQEPVAGRCRFTGLAYWAHCSVEHVTMALNAPHEWPHYEVQYLYALPVAPQPCTCPTGDGSLSWPCPRHSSQ